MSPLLVALLLLLVALIGARFTFGRRRTPLGPKVLIATGAPFVFLGFLVGPHATHLLPRSVVDDLTPLLALGLGWIGVLFGLQLDREHLRQFPIRDLLLAWLQAGIAFVICYAIGHLVLVAGTTRQLDAIVLAAAATACISAPSAMAIVSNTYRARGRVSRLLFYMASLDAAVGILALGITHAAYHGGGTGSRITLSLVEWLVVSTLLGFFFGVLFLSLTRIRPRRQEELMLFLIGLVVFAAGSAFYLSVSPLFVCMIAGIVIGNLSPIRRRAYAALSDWEKPIYVVVLVLAGALLQFGSWWILPLVGLYLVGRVAAKWLGAALAARFVPQPFELPSGFGLALVPQGGLSLAMAISFVMIYDPPMPELAVAVDLFFAAVVLAVGVSDLLGPFLVRSVLDRAGELRPEAAAAGVTEALGNG